MDALEKRKRDDNNNKTTTQGTYPQNTTVSKQKTQNKLSKTT